MTIWAYFDESGHTSQPGSSFTIAGLRATCDTWARFNAKWTDALAQYSAPWLHMRLLYSQSRRSPFRDWPTQKRHAFEMQMTELVRDELGKHSIVGSMKQVEVGDNIDSVYYGEYRGCLRAALFNLQEGETVNYVFATHEEIGRAAFEAYHEVVGKAYGSIRKNAHVGTITFAQANVLGSLQAADLVAWEFRRHVEQPTENRPAFEVLMGLHPHIYH